MERMQTKLPSASDVVVSAGNVKDFPRGSKQPMAQEPLPLSGVSVAGIETAIEVPSLGVVFDMGRCSRTAVNHPVVLVSHGHLDHVGAITQHAARRALMKMSEGVYLVPRVLVAAVERIFNAAGELDGNPIPHRVVPIEPGGDFALGTTRFVRPFPTFHRVPSQGYTVWERRHRLRSEFRGRRGEELGRLRAEGVAIDEPHDVPILSFTGDTRVEALERVPELASAVTLILETSFLDARVSVGDAREMGHVHLDEVLERHELFAQRDIVFSHFSARYMPEEVQQILDSRLPETLRGRVRALG
jgi:ribonuclease Z